jgi:glyoxylase-like metal-dependent hydrolase (beta-lactamase superfamily II)
MGYKDLMIKSFSSTPKGTNVYILINGQEAAVVDAAHSYDDIKSTLDELGARLKYILVTHGHLSHIHSISQVKKEMGGMICLHKSDAELLKEVDSHLEPDLLLKDNASLKLGKTTIKVLHTPGHTMGSLCFHIREVKALFTGDTLFKGEFGRIRGPHSMGLMLRSLKRLNSVIPPKTTVYPGHGPSTTMSKEAWLDTLDNLS